MWQQRRWRRLLNLIEHLPRASAFVEAVADDEELREAIRNAPPVEPRQRVSDWTPEVELLAAVHDRLGLVLDAVLVGAGGQPARLDPWPRPVTVLQEAQHDARRAAHARLVARLTPGRG